MLQQPFLLPTLSLIQGSIQKCKKLLSRETIYCFICRWNLRRITASPGYDVLFSLLVPEPERLSSKWNIHNAIETHLRPLFEDLKDVVSFNIKSQILYLTTLSMEPKQVCFGKL